MAGKKIWGRKRHLLVDTQGFVLAVKVLACQRGDVTGARLLLKGLAQQFPRLSHLFADHGYDGEPFEQWLQERLGYEGLSSSSEAFIQVASIRLLLTRLAPSRY